MKRTVVLILTLMIVVFSVVPSYGQKKKIAVLNFDYGTIRDRWWPGDWDIGRGITDILVTQLVKDGTYSVVERNRLDAVLSEQKLGMSGVVDAATAAQIGRVLGVSAVIVGSITKFSLDTRTIDTGGAGRMFGLGGEVGISTTTALVYIDARMIDTTTAEIIAVSEGRGQEVKRGMRVSASNYRGFGHLGFGGSGFQETILGKATRQSVEQVAKEVIAAHKKTAAEATVRAKVAYAGDGMVIVDAGKDAGIEVGQTLYVITVKKEIKSPTTGEVIKRLTEVGAELKVTEIDEKSATATVTKGNIEAIKEGDDVCTKPTF